MYLSPSQAEARLLNEGRAAQAAICLSGLSTDLH